MNREELNSIRNELGEAASELRHRLTATQETGRQEIKAMASTMGQVALHLKMLIDRMDKALADEVVMQAVCGCEGECDFCNAVAAVEAAEAGLESEDPLAGELQAVIDRLSQNWLLDDPTHNAIRMATTIGYSRAKLEDIVAGL